MGTYTITISTDNDAFVDDGKYHEIPRILRRLADRVEGGDLLGTTPLLDVNGGTVGDAVYDETSDHEVAELATWADMLRDLREHGPIQRGWTADLLIDAPRLRVWLARTTVVDGEPFDATVYVEQREGDGDWTEVGHYDGDVIDDARSLFPRAAGIAFEATEYAWEAL